MLAAVGGCVVEFVHRDVRRQRVRVPTSDRVGIASSCGFEKRLALCAFQRFSSALFLRAQDDRNH